MKKNLILVCAVFVAASFANSYVFAQELKTDSKDDALVWLKDYDKAVELAKKENKKIFVKWWANWCAPCKVMDKETFAVGWAGWASPGVRGYERKSCGATSIACSTSPRSIPFIRTSRGASVRTMPRRFSRRCTLKTDAYFPSIRPRSTGGST